MNIFGSTLTWIISAAVCFSFVTFPSSAQAYSNGGGHYWDDNATSTNSCVSHESDVLVWQWQAGQNQLTLNGSAQDSGSALVLTEALNQAGSAFWKTPFYLYTGNSQARSFSAAFSFRISHSQGISDNDGPGGDGLAFVINGDNLDLGKKGRGLGYQGLNNSVAVEFDSFNNGWVDRNSGNHIGINSSGRIRSKHARRVNQRFNDGDIWYAWIDYLGDKHKLEVRLSQSAVRPDKPKMAKRVRLPWRVGGSEAYVGFTSGTGDAAGIHEILSFDFVSSYAPIAECDSPEFSSEPVKTAVANNLYGYVSQANDATAGDVIFYRLINAPTAMSIDSNSGLISWLPTDQDVGEHVIEIQAEDSIGLRDRQSFTLTVLENLACDIEGSHTYQFTNFEDVSVWQLNGEAVALNPNNYEVLRLTDNLAQSGSAFLSEAIPLIDQNGFKASFSARFGFEISKPRGISDLDGKGADGLVFVIQTVDNNIGGSGGGIGYEGIQRSLGIEFDSWNNGSVDNDNGNHIGINTNGDMNSIVIKPIEQRFNNGQQWYAWIDYDGDRQHLEVSLANVNSRPAEPTLSYSDIDLATVLQYENAYVGFTSGTGAAGGNHDIFDFEFTNTIAPIGDCGALEISSIPPTDMTSGDEAIYQVEVSGAAANAVLTYSLLAGPTGASINDSGLLHWVSTGVGDVNFVINVQTSDGEIAEQSFNIEILPMPNQAPVANSIDLSSEEDTSQSVTLLASDINGDILTYTILQQPANGVVSGVTPNLVYTPNPNFNGTDSFTFLANDGALDSNIAIVSITINPINDVPVTQGQTVSVLEDTGFVGQLVGSDVDGDAISFSLQQPTNHGVVSVQSNGVFSFTPDNDFNGDDSFSFFVNDGQINSVANIVNIQVEAVNDQPIAAVQTVAVNEDNTVAILLSGIDIDGDNLIYLISAQPANGSLSGTAPDLVYSPNTDFNGTDNFTFKVNDGTTDSVEATVNLIVASVNDLPVADPVSVSVSEDEMLNLVLTGSDLESASLSYQVVLQPTYGTLSGIAPNLTFVPDLNFVGNDSFSFRVNDGSNDSLDATVSITVESINDQPLADSQSLTIAEDTIISIVLSGIDVDGDELNFEVVTQPSNGSLSGLAPNLVYTPYADFNGADQITFLVNDGFLDSVAASVEIQVTAVNDAPIADDVFATVDSGDSVSVILSGSDIEPTNSGLIFELQTSPQNGQITGSGANWSYTTNGSFTGYEQILYRAFDGENYSNTATIEILVSAINAAPQIISDPVPQTFEGTEYLYSVDATDSNNDLLQFELLKAPAGLNIGQYSGLITGSNAAFLEPLNVSNLSCEKLIEPSADFSTDLKWKWTEWNDVNIRVFGPVMVGQLTDDNLDGDINALDTPDVVLHERSENALIALSGEDGTLIWKNTTLTINGLGSPTIADLDGDGIVEIISLNNDRSAFYVLEHTGELKFTANISAPYKSGARDAISVADIDHDGHPEIIHGRAVYDNNGNLLFEGEDEYGGETNYGIISIVADINMTGDMEIIAGRTAYDSTGQTLWRNTNLPKQGFNAIGNFDNDEFPEIVFVGSGEVSLLDHLGNIIWGGVVLPGGGFGGPPTVADLDGDGEPEIGIASASQYVVLETDGTIKWTSPTIDVTSNRTGSSVFDFEGDGRAEVVYADERNLFIYDGKSGEVVYQIPHASGTTLEYPVIVDIDNDNQAEILLASNNDNGGNGLDGWGLRVYESSYGDWAPTRAIWNQHAYHIDNINDDGSVPQYETHGWLSHNSYRLNTFSDRPARSQADLAVFGLSYNETAQTLSATVTNHGAVATEDNASLSFYSGTSIGGILLGTVSVSTLGVGESQPVALSLSAQDLGDSVFANITYDHISGECQLNNNDTAAAVVTAEVADGEGLSDEQTYLYSQINTNNGPIITSGSNSQSVEDVEHSFTVTTVDPDRGDVLSYSLIGEPENLFINARTGVITADANTLSSGVYTFSIRIVDLTGLASEQSHTLSVTAADNNVPVITSSPVTSSVALTTYAYQITATEPDGDSITFALSEAPEGVTIDNLSGQLFWVPGRDQLGFNIIDIAVIDNRGASASQRFAVDVSDPYANNLSPEITSVPSGGVTAGEIFSYQLIATDPDNDPLSYRLENSGEGMSIDANGLFEWATTLDDAGKIAIVLIIVEDGRDGITIQSLAIPVIEPVNAPPIITSSANLSATEGKTYQYDVIAIDADGNSLAFTLIEGPAGMNIDSINGVVSWDAIDGTYRVSIRVSDLSGGSVYQNFIIAVNRNPVVTQHPLTLNSSDRVYTSQITATDPDGDLLNYSLVSGNSEFTVNPSTGEIASISTLPVGSYPVTIRISDQSGGLVDYSYSIIVVQNTAPVLSPAQTSFTASSGDTLVIDLGVADADGNAIILSIVSGGLPGLSFDHGNGLLTSISTLADVGSHQIVIVATDTVGDQSNRVTLDLTVTNNLPPTIESSALTIAYTDSLYEYQMIVTDPESRPLDYEIYLQPDFPAQIDASGLLSFIAPISALDTTQTITLRVTDSAGHILEQTIMVAIRAPNPNAPELSGDIPAQAIVDYPLNFDLIASDADGDTVDFSLISGPAGFAVNSLGQIDWTPQLFQVGLHSIVVRLFDGDNAVDIDWQIEVLLEPLPLEVNIVVDPQFIDAGELALLTVQITGGIAPEVDSASLESTPITLVNNQATITSNNIGRQNITVDLIDDGVITTFTSFLMVTDPTDLDPPLVTIETPSEAEIVSSPVDILGTVEDANLIDVYLYARRSGSTDVFDLYRGSQAFSSEPIAQFDPTMLRNGQYDLILQATDVNNQTSAIQTTVVVDGGMKIGNFNVTLEDLSIPMAGIPIRVTRSYDSRRKHENLDFGYGWSIDYQNISIEESSEPTVDWYYSTEFKIFTINDNPVNVQATCMRSNLNKTVTVTLPNDDVEVFKVRLDGITGSQIADNDPDCNFTASTRFNLWFDAEDGTTSTLEAYDNPNLFMINGNLVTDLIAVEPVNVIKYRLTTKSGFVYNLDQDFGIETIADPNGNTLTYSESGITHSAGPSVLFSRDIDGRIESITDPMGQSMTYGYSANGNLDSSTDRENNTSTYQYDEVHGLTDLVDPLGRPLLKNIYDEDGRLIAQEDNDGNRTEFLHDLTGRTSQVTDRLGRITQFAYDQRGNVETQVDALGNITRYTHDANDNQLSQTDALGHISLATFDSEDNQLTQTDELGRVTGFTYNEFGKEVTITDPLDNVYSNDYDSVGNLISIADPGGNLLGANLINPQGLVTQLTDTFDNVTIYTYDGNGNKSSETNPLGHLTTWTYDANGNVLTETVQRSVGGILTDETTTYVYDTLDRLIETTDALGNRTQMIYDEVGNKSQDIDALDRVTVYTYDVYRRITRTDTPDGSFTRMDYDAEGNLTRETDVNGNTTTFTYDALNRLITTTYADGSTTSSNYDELGRVSSETDERGNTTSYQYDAAGQRSQIIDALGNITRFTYDANSNLETMTDARGNTTQYSYDIYDNRVSTNWPDGTTSSEVTDRKGRRTSQTDQNGNTTTYAYDQLNRLISVTDALNNITRYSYDEAGNKLTQTDAEGRVTSWTYDALGRELTRTLPLGQLQTRQYDAVGNIRQMTDFNGQITTYSYDLRDRLSTITYDDASTETYTYDNHGNRLSANDRNNLNQSWSFDNRHRLIQVIDAQNNQIEYAYDGVGNKIQQTTTPSNTGIGQITSYGYDGLNRLQNVTDSNALETTYSYDPNGNRASVAYANGNTTRYSYDLNNRLIQQRTENSSNNVIADYLYTLDPGGHRLQIDELNRSNVYTYDASYKLLTESITDAINANHNASYSYDDVGNRTSSIINGVQTDYTVDDNDRLIQQGGEDFTYDDNGNTLSKTIDGFISTYSYDTKNLLSSAQINNAGVIINSSYDYDVDGIRIQKTEDSTTTDYLIDPNRDYAQVIRETNDSTLISIDYLYGDDLIQQSQNAANERYYVYDGLGSTRLLTDPTGVITDTYDYEAFGSVLNQIGTTDNNFQFTGEQFDAGLDQYYLRARYYDQDVGRFTQMDTWLGIDLEPLTQNKYIYTYSSPIDLIDPSGLFGILDVMSVTHNLGRLVSTASPLIFQIGSRTGGSAAGRKLVWNGACFLVEELAQSAISQAIGLYMFDDVKLDKPYVGQSKRNVVERLRSHFRKTRTYVENVTHILPVSVAPGVVDKLEDVMDALEQSFIDDLDGPGGKKGQDGGSANKRNQVDVSNKKRKHLKKLMDKFRICD